MKKLFFLFIVTCYTLYLPAQSIVAFHEDFELPSLGDSLQNSTDPVGGVPWAITTNLQSSGFRADSNRAQTGVSVYLTTSSFTTAGYNNVSLQFSQICKLQFAEGGQIEISTDGGTIWNALGPVQYRGTGILISSGLQHKFSESSYPEWLSGDTITKPTNAWWKNEFFDISTFAANQTNVKIRFKFTGSGIPQAAGRYGWLLDNIKVCAANNELMPPIVTFKTPILKDTVYVTGPFTVQVYVTDSSALSGVNLIYNINGGNDITIPMTNTTDSTFIADIPSYAYDSTVNYKIQAADIYNNTSALPGGGYQSFLIKKGLASVQIGNATTNGLFSPLYIAAATNTNLYSYNVSLFENSEILSGGVIESLAFSKADLQGYTLGNATLRIYLKSTSVNYVPSTYASYLTEKSGAIKVYESNTQNINTTIDWQSFTCNTGSLFSQNGSENLLVFVEWYRPGNATGAVNWHYTTVAGKSSIFYGPGVIPATTNTSGQRANMKINFQSSNSTYDATILNFASPSQTMTANTIVPVSVRVKNLGSATLTKAKIHWMVDGVYQGVQSWTASLQQDFVSLPFTLGNVNLTVGPHILRAWTELPNDSIDQSPGNDTTTFNIFACQDLNGVYTVGSATSNFPTFNDVNTALNNCGITGPVTFKIKTGTYNQQLIIPFINNVSPVNTITFESESGNKNDVIFQYSSNATADNFVLRLDAARFIKIKNISFKALGATYGRVVELANGASYNTIDGCNLEMPVTTSSNYAGIYSASTIEQYNTFKNNVILNGYYGIYNYGASTSVLEKGNVIEGNTITGFYYYGIYSYYQDSTTINSNTVENGLNSTSVYAIYINYNDNLVSISKNKVYVHSSGTSTNYGMYVSYCDNTTGQQGIIANNFISQSGTLGTVYGLSNSYSTYQNYYHNSVNVTSGTLTGGYSFYATGGSNVNVYNNNFINTGGGYAYYIGTIAAIVNSDNNNLFTTGINLAYWSAAKTTLAALQIASVKDSNSISINPGYVSISDLHVTNFALAAAGKINSVISEDIDGNVRATPPCIGADEFIVPQIDAGIILIKNPSPVITVLNQDINVTIKNFGILPLTSAIIKWSVNGVLQTSYNWTGNLIQNAKDTVIVGNHTFSLGQNTLKVYSEMPNNQQDIFYLNDTLLMDVYACAGPLNGTYTIGSSGSDYSTINAAVNAMLKCGVAGPTVFNINPGTYNEQFIIPKISGTSATNTITFKSLNNDSTSVIIDASSAVSGNYAVKLDSSQYVKISYLTMKNETTTGRVVEISGNSKYCEISNCVLKSNIGTTNSTASVIYSYNSKDEYIKIINNQILGGYYGVYLYGVGSAAGSKEMGNVVQGNIIKDFYYYGTYLYYQDSLKFIGNLIQNISTSGIAYGLYSGYADNAQYLKNNIQISGTSTDYCMYIYYNNSSTGNGLVANNFLSQTVGTGTVYGLYSYYSSNMNYYYNSININNGSTSGYAFYITGGSYCNLLNNIFTNSGGGYAYYAATITAIVNSNYNNLFATGTNLAYWSSAKTDLTALQIASGKDVNSISIDPIFFSSNNLHTDNVGLYAKGTFVALVTDDIDGELRIAIPCIGADEYAIVPNDAKVKALYTLGKIPKSAGSPHFVKSIIENKGANTLYNLAVNLVVSGSNTFTDTYSIDSLVTGAADTVIFAGFTPVNFGSNNVKVTVPSDDLLSNNELNYLQVVTDTVFGYADTSKATTFLGFNTGEGLFLSKYFMNGSKVIKSVKAFITNSNTIGQKLYGVILNSNGIIVDTSFTKTITAADTNNWVKFNFVHPILTTSVNENFYVGIVQLTGSTGGYYPLGCQAENPTRSNTFYYSTDITGSALTETTQFGRFMIEAVIGNPPATDASVENIIAPETGCNMVNKSVTIKIDNLGTSPITSGVNTLTAKYGLLLNGNLTNVVSETVNTTILPASSYIFTFNTTITLPANGADSNYHFKAWVELLNDANLFNDTAFKSLVSLYTPQVPVVISPVTINYATQANLTATTTDTVLWYANLTDSLHIAGGSPFITPYLFDTTTYYAEARVIGGGSGGAGGLKITEINIGDPDAIEIQNVSGAPINATGWVVAVSNTYGTIASVNANLWQLGNIPANQVLIKDDLSSSGQYWGSNLMWNPGPYPTYTGWAMIIDNLGNIVDFLAWGWKSADIQGFTANINGFPITIGSKWTGDGVIDPSADYIVRQTIDNDNAADFVNIAAGSIGSVNPNMINTGGNSGNTGACASNKVPVQVIVTNIPAIDAGIDQITSPIGSVPAGINTPVTVIIKNWGNSDLTSTTIGWSVDGVVKIPVIWNGILSNAQSSTPYQIANIPFFGGLHIIKAWTYNPNNTPDIYSINDTASTSFSACMSGNFTIGTTGNFQTFNEAIQTINAVGVCGNVIFDVQAGTYNEQLIINEIPNLGPNSTITFRSLNGINTSVILTYSVTSTTNAVVKLNGSDYIRFENMTIKATGSSITRAVDMGNGANYNKFTGNKIETDISSTSTYAAIYSTSTAKDKYNEFINNRISGGYYGIYWYGSSANFKTDNKFIGNTIVDFNYYGLYLYYNDSITVDSNIIQNSATSVTAYGMYVYYNDNLQKIVKNKIILNASTSNTCMYISYTDNNALYPGLIANNFISQSLGTGTVYGIYNYYSTNQNYYHNSINVTAGSASAYAFYSTSGSGTNIMNNIFSNTGGGYAYYVATPAGINSSNNNNLYATGTNLAYWTSAHTSLASLKTASGKDQNSLSVYPDFFSTTDLHLMNFELNASASPLASVSDDIDGSVRNLTLPDIGADEFTLPLNDAGINAVVYPFSPAVVGLQNVKVRIRNFGANNLIGANIQWSVNGVLQISYPWSANLVSGDTNSVVIGSHNFTGGSSTIKVWTNLPNGVTDGFNANDTLTVDVIFCSGALSGVYTIGGISANYQTINQAVQSIKYCGVNGPVTFNINPGNYNEQLLIPSITGASSINTITFKSANNDSTGVIINFEPTNIATNYVVKLDGAGYIKFKYLSIVNNTQLNLGRVVELINSASNNEFSNNVIQSVPSTVTTTAGIYSYNTKDENNTIANNLITGGYYGIYLYGVGTAAGSKESGNIILNNIIKDFYYYGLYLYYQDSVTAIGNIITNASNSGTSYGLYSYYCDNNNYQKNKILLNNTGTTYGMYNYYNNNVSGNGLVANNFISQSIGTGSVYAIYSSTSSNINYYNNSINVTQGSTTNYNLYFTGGSSNKLFNNSVVNTGNGYAIYASSTSSISSSDFNNFYTTGVKYAYWGTACANLAAWQTASSKDANSVSLDPDYLTSVDLHVYTSALNNIGTVVAQITDDIDGQVRSTTTPDIGADEYAPLPIDLGVTSIFEPAILYSQVGGNIQIKCVIKNFGADSVSNFNVVYKAGNGTEISQIYSSYLLANKVDTVIFTTLLPVVAGPFGIKVYTSILNDGNYSNDTTKINYFGVSFKNIPYSENFDNSVEEWFTTETATLWEKGVPTASLINTAHSAPDVWATKLNGNYTNLSTSTLYSPIFNNGVFKADTLKFWHWIDAEINYDGGYIEYLNSSDDWIVLGNIVPDTNAINWYNGTTLNAWTGTSTGWQQSAFKISNLTNLGNSVQFRFVFNTDANTNNFNGWAIDDFELTLAPIPADAGVIDIISPLSTAVVGDIVTVTVTVKNFGTDALVNIPVKYQIGSGGVVTETLTGPLASGATANYIFTQQLQVANLDFTICAFTGVIGDIYTQNNVTCKTVNVLPAANDVGISEILEPGSAVPSGTTNIKVVIKNYGTTTQTSVPVSYQRNALTPITALWTGTLTAGATVEFTFPIPMNVPIGNSFSLCAFTTFANDAFVHNDTVCKSVLLGIDDIEGSNFWLGQNMPNPTTGITNIEYSLPVEGEVKFDIMNLLGQKVYSTNQKVDAGKHKIDLNVNDLSAGVYYYTIEFKGKRLIKKMVVNK